MDVFEDFTIRPAGFELNQKPQKRDGTDENGHEIPCALDTINLYVLPNLKHFPALFPSLENEILTHNVDPHTFGLKTQGKGAKTLVHFFLVLGISITMISKYLMAVDYRMFS